MKKIVNALGAGIIALMLIGEPVALAAQQSNVQAQACSQAQNDVQMEVNKTLWLAAGFFFGLLGIAGAYIIEPTPPASKLLGKSPEYVAAYTDCYKDAGKKIQTNAAIKGCVIGAIVYAASYGCCILFGIGTSAAASTAP